MTETYKMRISAAFAAFTGLTLRLFFVLKFPMTNSGDGPFYIELAWNWLKYGVYGLSVNGHIMPADIRTPGYPAFLAAVFTFAGNSARAVMFTQALVDMATCFLIALIAARLAPERSRPRVALAALWLAALCPFTANYAAVTLTETLATFFTALAILVLVETPAGAAEVRGGAPLFPGSNLSRWFLAGIVAGFGTLVRPETPLVLLAAGLVLMAKWRRPPDWPKLMRAGLLMGTGLVLPLLPWAARNARTFHEVQFLASRNAGLPGEYNPSGINAWTRTWLWRFRDVYLVPWKLEDEPISVDDLPPSAFDSPEERARVAGLLNQYNDTLTVDPALDNSFREIARERTARHPLRTYVEIPLLRSLAMWFTPRVELLPYSGQIFPLADEWEYDRQDFLVSLGLAAVNCLYVALALAGAWMARRRPGCALLIVFILVRTIFFAFFWDTPEPRYMLECFPAVIALAAQIFASSGRQLSSTGSG
ncbi:MAG: glycosyltransferase family 39 protein [Candidatus Acidiferrales bacterium]